MFSKVFRQKKQAYEEFHTLQLDDPIEYDDIYIEAHNLLKICERSKEELENLRRDADLMFGEDGIYIKNWTEKL